MRPLLIMVWERARSPELIHVRRWYSMVGEDDVTTKPQGQLLGRAVCCMWRRRRTDKENSEGASQNMSTM
jgi:hypothetical protein